METLYVSDLDGTLLRSDESLSVYTTETLNRLIADRLSFTIATARTPESASRILDGLNLRLPVVYMNGGYIKNPRTGRLHAEYFLDHSLISSVLALFNRFSISPIVYAVTPEGEKKIFYLGINNSAEELFINSRLKRGDRRLRLVESMDFLHDHRIIMINGIEIPQRLAPLMDSASKECAAACTLLEDVYCPGFCWIEIAHRAANKRDGIIFLRSYLKPDRVVSFGDNLNDIGMFTASDAAFAVANAHEKCRQCATGIIESNDSDGVAKYLAGTHNARV
ncbi:MAG: HAD hydrolase family protein [Spirochaetales bacterium]|nr:HAD hydrolase family protein [Spirochaetales bacterium]